MQERTPHGRVWRYARVPKTGSKSLLNAVEKIGCNQLIMSRSHRHTSVHGHGELSRNERGLLVLREPCDRFISAFNHLKDKLKGGASKTDDGRLEIKAVRKAQTAEEFAFALRANESLRRILWQEEI